MNQTVAKRILEKLGYVVTLAGNGKEALDSFKARRQASRAFDLVLMDVQMPEMDGLEALGRFANGKQASPEPQ